MNKTMKDFFNKLGKIWKGDNWFENWVVFPALVAFAFVYVPMLVLFVISLILDFFKL